MLHDKRRNRIAKLVIGGMGEPDSSYETSEYKSDDEEMPKKKKDYDSYDAYKMAIGSMLQAIRSDDVDLMCRSFKAAYKACEMYEEE